MIKFWVEVYKDKRFKSRDDWDEAPNLDDYFSIPMPETVNAPSIDAMKKMLRDKYPSARWVHVLRSEDLCSGY